MEAEIQFNISCLGLEMVGLHRLLKGRMEGSIVCCICLTRKPNTPTVLGWDMERGSCGQGISLYLGLLAH